MLAQSLSLLRSKAYARRPLNSRQHPRKNSAKIKIRVPIKKVPTQESDDTSGKRPTKAKVLVVHRIGSSHTHGVGVGVGVGLSSGVGVGVKVAVAVGVGVAVAVAVAVGVGVGLGVGVGVGLIVLAVCMAIISLSDNAVFQIAACWMYPFSDGCWLPDFSSLPKLVVTIALVMVGVPLNVPAITPSTNASKFVPFLRNTTLCHIESNAVPPSKLTV